MCCQGKAGGGERCWKRMISDSAGKSKKGEAPSGLWKEPEPQTSVGRVSRLNKFKTGEALAEANFTEKAIHLASEKVLTPKRNEEKSQGLT